MYINRFFHLLIIALPLLSTACGTPAVQTQPEEQEAQKVVRYQTVLGQRLSAQDAADFVASNNCTPSREFQLCPSAGLALWTDEDKIVQIVYLYVSNSADFAAYKGELPFDLTSSDTMATVEQKIGQPNVQHAPRPVWKPSLPDDGGLPKLTYYRASYERIGMTILYDAESASDTSANIYAILVSN